MWRLIGFAVVSFLCLRPALAGDPFPDKVSPNIIKPRVQFGTYGSGQGQLNDPGAIAINDQNEIFIAECYNNRIQVFDRDGHAKRSWTGSGKGELRCPQGIAVSDAGEAYVSESRGRIVVFDEIGQFRRSFGTHGSGRGQLNDPGNLSVRGDILYVTDVGNNRIVEFSRDGRFLKAIGSDGPENGSFQIPKSVAVDSDSNIYVVDALHRIQKFDSHGSFLKSWGAYGGLPGQLAEPSDVSVVGDHVYVADTVNHRLQAFDEEGKLSLVWGRHPEVAHEGEGHTHYPSSIKVSPDSSMAVVCEPFEYRCQIFDMQSVKTVADNNTNAWWEKFPRFHYGGGARIARVAVMESAKSHLIELQARLGLSASIASLPSVPREMLIITEPDLHRVVAFSLDTPTKALSLKAQADKTDSVDIPTMYSIGSFGHKPGQFATLAAKMAMMDGTLLVGDAGNNNIQQFHLLTGQYIRTLFAPGTGPGEFHGPSGIAEVPNGLIYIGDFHNNRIQAFDKNYNFQFSFGKTGDGPGELFGPLSLAFDSKYERLYVTDSGNQRVQVFDPKGNFLFQFGHLTRPGQWGEGTFQWPFDVAVSPKDFVYVSDPSLQYVQKFDRDGKFVTQWGGWGTEPGQFYKPKGIDVDEAGNVYVIDFGNHRGQVFDENGRFLGIFGEGVLYPVRAGQTAPATTGGATSPTGSGGVKPVQ